MKGARSATRVLQYVCTIAGIAAIVYCAVVWTGAERFQARAARRFGVELQAHATRRVPLSARPALIPGKGEPVGKIEIPRLGISVMVVEGVGDDDLRHAVGHIPGTAFPSQSGNVAIAGHRDTFFRPLRSIRPDDAITLSTLEGTYRYRVVSREVVRPGDVRVLRPAGRDILTLITCYPFYYVGAAPERFVVRAARW